MFQSTTWDVFNFGELFYISEYYSVTIMTIEKRGVIFDGETIIINLN